MNGSELTQISCPVCGTTIRVKKKSTSCREVGAMIATVLCFCCIFFISWTIGPVFCGNSCRSRNKKLEHHCPDCGASFTYRR